MCGSGQGPHLGTASPSSECCQSSDIFSLWPLQGGEASLLKVTLLSADPQPLTGQQGSGRGGGQAVQVKGRPHLQ